MKKIFFTILLTANLALDLFSQAVNIYKFSPQHLTVNTFSLSLERASSPMAKTSLNISPFVTYYDRMDFANVKEKLAGGGLELGRKMYVTKPDTGATLKGFYALGSVTYGYYVADYQRSDDSAFTSYSYTGYGGSLAYTSSGRFYHETIHKLGADVAIGYQVPYKKVFYVDMFFGAGMRYAISSQGDKSIYKNRFIDIGHSGIIPKAGIKFGLMF
jgi:hypothetical protein